MKSHHKSPSSQDLSSGTHRICSAGYGISSAGVLVSAGFQSSSLMVGDPERVLVHELWGLKRARRRSHVSSFDSIHRNFQTRVGESSQEILRFAGRYGLLMERTHVLHRHSSSTYEEIWAESVDDWVTEAELVRTLSEGLRLLRSKVQLPDEQFIQLIERVTTLADRQWLAKGRLVSRPNLRSDSRFEVVLKAVIQSKIDRLGGVSLDVETGTVGFRPKSVLGSIYISLFDELFRARSVHRKCKWCGWFFPLTHSTKQICSKKCENALYRYRQTRPGREDPQGIGFPLDGKLESDA